VTDFTLKPIGVVRSAFKERKAVPRLGAAAAVEIYPEYFDALHRIEKHSHLWVFVWLDRAERDVLQVIPRGIAERTEENKHGVFAVRSPVRPNPIGLTLAKIQRVDGAVIELDRLDFLDGTPVIDLKPYFLSRDAVYAAKNEQIGQPANREALRAALRMQAVNFAGRPSDELELAVDIATAFRADIMEMVEPGILTVHVPISRPQLADAFTGMTRVSPGRGTLRFGTEDVVRLVWESGMVEYELLPEGGYKQRPSSGDSQAQ
jgi:tRNA (adenine37-N6)-methyltransferase